MIERDTPKDTFGDTHDAPDVAPHEAEVGGVLPREVLRFWFEELSLKDHFNATPELDAEIERRFGALVEGLEAAGYPHIWESEPDTALALLIALDQFPRNIHRGGAGAFLLDGITLDIAQRAIGRGFLEGLEASRAKYILMPLMHSEDLAVQDQGVALFEDYADSDTARHARAHREVVRRFGRFPERNAALGRESTAEEAAWLEAGGYAAELRDL